MTISAFSNTILAHVSIYYDNNVIYLEWVQFILITFNLKYLLIFKVLECKFTKHNLLNIFNVKYVFEVL